MRAFFGADSRDGAATSLSVGGVMGLLRFRGCCRDDDAMSGRLDENARGTSIRSKEDFGKWGDADGVDGRGIGGGFSRFGLSRCPGGGVDVARLIGNDGGRKDYIKRE